VSLEQTKSTRPDAPRAVGRDTLRSSLDGERLQRWLQGPRLRDSDGQILSWLNPSHPGYPYPEATALWLSWAAWRAERDRPVPRDGVRAAARWLRDELTARGAIGREGQHYVFDTGLAFHALVRAARVPGLTGLEPGSLAPLSAGLDRFLEADSPVLPGPRSRPRWSDRWEGHLLRAAALVALAARWLGDDASRGRALRLAERARPLEPEEPCYVHALAYQAEGELLLAELGCCGHRAGAQRDAARLAALQRDDGMLPAWSDRPQSARCDATAQAVRLWSALDPHTYRQPIRAALASLARCQQPSGGLPYAPGRGDLNTWVGLFTDQALHWTQRGAEPRDLL
jgi:hypothetical protein